jgi:hypothetical protein
MPQNSPQSGLRDLGFTPSKFMQLQVSAGGNCTLRANMWCVGAMNRPPGKPVVWLTQ